VLQVSKILLSYFNDFLGTLLYKKQAMKIIITGSLGYISKPLTEELIKKEHSVTVISSSAEKQKDIEAMGAKAAIGTMEDVDFLTATFTGADAVYSMLAPGGNFADPDNSSAGIPTRLLK
jgi:uncharacterized protein YbjT (DUF2867 family)